MTQLTHADVLDRLRALLAAQPLKPPRIIYAAPDGRHLTRPSEAQAPASRGGVPGRPAAERGES